MGQRSSKSGYGGLTYMSQKEKYMNEPIHDAGYGSVKGYGVEGGSSAYSLRGGGTKGQSMVDVGGRGDILPPINPLAYVTNDQMYGMTVQLVANQSQDPRGDIDNKIPIRVPHTLQDPRLLGALLDRQYIATQAKDITPVQESATAYVGIDHGNAILTGNHGEPSSISIADPQLMSIYSSEDPSALQLRNTGSDLVSRAVKSVS